MSASSFELLRQLKSSREDDYQFNRVFKLLEEKINNLVKDKEIQNKTCIPIGGRFLEVQDVDSSYHKLTINPCDGRTTLKVSKKASEKVKVDLIQLSALLMQEELPAITLRGKVGWHRDRYVWIGQSESKKFSHRIEYKPEEQ